MISDVILFGAIILSARLCKKVEDWALVCAVSTILYIGLAPPQSFALKHIIAVLNNVNTNYCPAIIKLPEITTSGDRLLHMANALICLNFISLPVIVAVGMGSAYFTL